MPRITFNSSFYLDNNELSAFRNGNLEIHCLSIRLEKPPSNENKYLGSGLIRQTTTNKFEFVMYSKKLTSSTDILDEVFGNNELRPGQLFPKSHYYKLTCIDEKGRKWISNAILRPNRKASKNGTLISGYFDEIICHVRLPEKVKKDYLSLEYSGEYKIPANISTHINKTIGGKQIAISSTLDTLQFTRNKMDFSLRNEDMHLQTEVRLERKRLPSNFETRITESLQFVFGYALSWSIMLKQSGKSGEITLRATSNQKVRGVKPPVSSTRDTEIYFCNLFYSYLAYITPSASTHPISAQIRSVALANSINVETLALVLSVAVEGVLRHINTKTVTLSEDELLSVEDAKKYFKNWGGSKRITARINGLLRSILENPSAKDVLNELTKERVTTPRHKEAWESLRNKLAHGGRMGSTPLQEFLDLTNSVLVLFYHLVFYIIGYQGQYPDYSINGWPERNYPLDKDYV
jgi:hypothetical protein